MGKMLRKIMALAMVVAFTGGFALPASAEASLDDILKRVEALEKENASLKAEVMALKTAPVATVAAAPAAGGNFLKTKPEIELYGFIKADAVFSDSEASSAAGTNSSIAAYNAPRNTLSKHQRDFNISGQSTRFGLNFKPVALDNGGNVSGKIEMDLSANSGSTYQPRMRLAYVQLDYEKWALTAGQAWDIIAPLNPNTLNDAVLWRAGNIGSRHPQVYVTNKLGDVLGGKWTSKVGIMDTDDPYQENSGVPVGAAGLTYDTKIMDKPVSLMLGGLYGQNSTDLLGISDEDKSNDIYAFTTGATVKLADWFSIKAEGFSGAKLDDFFGGTATGLSNSTVTSSKGLRVMGGFVELTYNPIKKVETNFGMGLDELVTDKSSGSVPSNRTAIWSSNRTYYSNVKYSLTKDLLVGLEYQRFDTQWLDGIDNTDNRIQSSLIYKF